jgi:hypothetical protein
MMINPLPLLGESESIHHGYGLPLCRGRVGADTTDSHRRSEYERAPSLYRTDHIKLAKGRG